MIDDVPGFAVIIMKIKHFKSFKAILIRSGPILVFHFILYHSIQKKQKRAAGLF